jgi:thiol-disulfide isomerase/thioredoxin
MRSETPDNMDIYNETRRSLAPRGVWKTAMVVAGALAVAIIALYFVRWVVRRTGREMFDETKNRLVLIHADWCGHCKTLLAEGGVWDQVKAGLPGVGVDEIIESANAPLVRSLGVTSFPDIRILKGGVSVAKFEGVRTARDIIQFALKHTS